MWLLTPEEAEAAQSQAHHPGSRLPRICPELVPWPGSSNSVETTPQAGPRGFLCSPPGQASLQRGSPPYSLTPPPALFLQEMVRRQGRVLIPPAPTLVCTNFHSGLPATAYLPRAKRLEKWGGGTLERAAQMSFSQGKNSLSQGPFALFFLRPLTLNSHFL